MLRSRVPALIALTLALAACGARSGHVATLDYEFDHPAQWTAIEGIELPNAGDEQRDAVGLDRRNWVTVVEDRLPAALTPAELADGPRKLRANYGAAMEAAGVRLLGEPRLGRRHGFDALEYEVGFADDDGTPLHTRVVELFRGEQSFSVGCQSTPPHAAEIEAGCRQVLDTLEPTP